MLTLPSNCQAEDDWCLFAESDSLTFGPSFRRANSSRGANSARGVGSGTEVGSSVALMASSAASATRAWAAAVGCSRSQNRNWSGFEHAVTPLGTEKGDAGKHGSVTFVRPKLAGEAVIDSARPKKSGRIRLMPRNVLSLARSDASDWLKIRVSTLARPATVSPACRASGVRPTSANVGTTISTAPASARSSIIPTNCAAAVVTVPIGSALPSASRMSLEPPNTIYGAPGSTPLTVAPLRKAWAWVRRLGTSGDGATGADPKAKLPPPPSAG